MIVPVTKAFETNIRMIEIARSDAIRREATENNIPLSTDALKPIYS
jgi:hypothetical protein